MLVVSPNAHPSPYLHGTQPPSAAAADATAPPAEPQGALIGKHEDSVWSVAWTPKGQLLSGSVDETVRAWCVAFSCVFLSAGNGRASLREHPFL